MKKYVALVMALLMAITCMTGCGSAKAEDTVMTVGKAEISWDEFMYWLGAASQELANYYSSYQGTAVDWNDDCMFDKGITNADWCIKRAKETALEIHSIELVAKEKGVTVSEDDEKNIESQIKQIKEENCQSEDKDAEFAEFLKNAGLTLESYKTIMRLNALYTNLYKELYGEDGSKMEAEKIADYAKENDYVCSAHILLRTVEADDQGGIKYDEEGNTVPLADDVKAQKKAQADSIAKELQAIEDSEKRYARFKEIMNEVSEDPGKESFPDGYCFTTGSMVEIYDTTSRELEEYQVSDTVESGYGYHVIIKLPITKDSLVASQSAPAPMSAVAGPEIYAEEAESWSKDNELETVKAYKDVDFSQFFTDEGFNFVSFAEYQAGDVDTKKKED